MAVHSNQRIAWLNRFHTPSVSDLREPIKHPMLSIFDAAREVFREGPGITEVILWQGLPWRWTLVYPLRGCPCGRPLAYLIPDPQRVQVAVPLTADLIDCLPVRRLKRPIRDGITHAKSAAGIWWPTWDLASRQALDEVADLVRLKRKHLVPESVLAASA